MSNLKYRIPIGTIGNSKKIVFGMNNNKQEIGYEHIINGFIEESKEDMLNPIINHEIKRFKYKNENSTEYLIEFGFKVDTSTYKNDFKSVGFTDNEIKTQQKSLLNSFFILDIYNTEKNKKIGSVYLTKVFSYQRKKPTNNYTYPIYKINKNTQFYYIDLPIYIFDNLVTGYGRFSFYNGKTGKIHRFKKDHEILFNIEHSTWKFKKLSNDLLNLKEELALNIENHPDVQNQQIETIKYKKHIYPGKLGFDLISGKYVKSSN